MEFFWCLEADFETYIFTQNIYIPLVRRHGKHLKPGRRWTDVIQTSSFLLAITLILSIFVYLWNPLEFPHLRYDEGTYIGRAMHVLVTKSPQEGKFYDHPYFGQLFLAGILWLTGYPDTLQSSADGNVVQSVKMLWLIPRVLIGTLAVLDSFLVYKISERLYNTKIGFIAAILFTVMSMSFLRTVFLESLQLPLLLLSIFLAVHLGTSRIKDSIRISMSITLLSGIFMGLAIFTKIPVVAMIPLVGFLVFTNSNIKLKMVALWLVPVILIPLIWPGYSLIHGEFGYWWVGVFWQTHRQMDWTNFIEINSQLSLTNAILSVFVQMPVLVVLGLAGLVYATVRRDFVLLLWIVPFFIFLYFIGFVRDFHLIPLVPALCISSARLIEGLSNFIPYEKIRKILPWSIISVIAIIGLANIIILLTLNDNDEIVANSALVTRYLQDNKNDKISMISNHVYSWIPKYVFHLDNEYLIPEVYVGQKPKNEKVLMVVDQPFRNILYGSDAVGESLRKIYDKYSSTGTIVYGTGSDKVVLPKTPSVSDDINTVNLIDSQHVWKTKRKALISQTDGDLNILVKTNKGKRITGIAFLETKIKNLEERPLLLSLNFTTRSPDSNTKYFIEITYNKSNDRRILKHEFKDTSGVWTHDLFLLPNEIVDRPIKFRFDALTSSSGNHTLNVTRANIIFDSSH